MWLTWPAGVRRSAPSLSLAWPDVLHEPYGPSNNLDNSSALAFLADGRSPGSASVGWILFEIFYSPRAPVESLG